MDRGLGQKLAHADAVPVSESRMTTIINRMENIYNRQRHEHELLSVIHDRLLGSQPETPTTENNKTAREPNGSLEYLELLILKTESLLEEKMECIHRLCGV